MSYSESSLAPGVSTEPNLNIMMRIVLDEPQRDMAVISEALTPDVRSLARHYIDKYRAAA